MEGQVFSVLVFWLYMPLKSLFKTNYMPLKSLFKTNYMVGFFSLPLKCLMEDSFAVPFLEGEKRGNLRVE